jgi:predicted nucleic acid-binding protein
VTTPDTSVVVAAFARWHAQHQAARAALERADSLLAHVAVEAYSVLTRLPPPRRVPGHLVLEFLHHQFGGSVVSLDGQGYAGLLALAADRRIVGGAVYDALIATNARRAGVAVVTLDERAAAVYEAIGTEYQLIA